MVPPTADCLVVTAGKGIAFRHHQAAKCPHSSDSFNTCVEEVYLPFVPRAWRPSTYSGYKTYFESYLKPRTGKYALRDFTLPIVASLLRDIAAMRKLNSDTLTKIRSILSGIFSYAMSEGHFPARSAADNPASRARIPESASEPKPTVAARREDVQTFLTALKGMLLERAAVGIMAFTGCRPSEARGLRWEEWDRAKQHIAVRRGVWHRIVGTTKTEQSERFVTVTDELREILLDLWKAQGSPAGRLRQRKYALLRGLEIPPDALPGSLALAQPNCQCAEGEGHPGWSLTFMVDGNKRVERIPNEWVKQIRPLVEQDASLKKRPRKK